MNRSLACIAVCSILLAACGPTTRFPPVTSTPRATNTPAFDVGSTWTSPKDGMTMLYVPAGEFSMGREDSFDNNNPVHMVYLDSYWMDQTEVTNAMYARCVRAGQCVPPSASKSRTLESYYGNPEYDDYPVIYVSWNDASAYCEWRGEGTRLPTEAEWEKAASWDADKQVKRVYPWGNSFNCSFANHSGSSRACRGDTARVGNYPTGASFYGLLDMGGNVWEWVFDWYDAYPGNTVNDADYGAKYHVLRGGSWEDRESGIRSTYRFWYDPAGTSSTIGFRCARSE
ncbi:MAG: formylglycine-generating enzyme family protein [Chloroflexota bacterium]